MCYHKVNSQFSIFAGRGASPKVENQTTAAVRRGNGSLPEAERPTQLLPMAKILTDTVKMIAYRAETALVGLLRKHLKKEDEARAWVRELLVSSADILPNEKENTLTVRIHRMACPAHDKAISSLLADLTKAGFHHPQTGALIVYELT